MSFDVAPYTGAWIETDLADLQAMLDASHPTRVRGLKQELLRVTDSGAWVAPYTGAWIEP